MVSENVCKTFTYGPFFEVVAILRFTEREDLLLKHGELPVLREQVPLKKTLNWHQVSVHRHNCVS